ncbi:MAG TPA: metallophosphoesterase family protein [Acidimicrobiales bacterium]|nr:metallophosphoesterase family protein [Acidimicrobiales bacterium]
MSGPGQAVGKIGFLADTHSRKPDGSDLPDAVLRAFEDVDLIVHLGDIGHKGILTRLAAAAPVLVPAGANKGYVPHAGGGEAVKVLQVGRWSVGLWFNLAQPDKKIVVGEDSIDFGSEPFDKLMKRRFGDRVSVVAFAGTHRPLEQHNEGVLFFNPGSPTLPMPGCSPSVAVLDVKGRSPSVRVVSVG